MEILALILFVSIFILILYGYPVAFTLSGISILFALICIPFGIFDPAIFKSIPLFRFVNGFKKLIIQTSLIRRTAKSRLKDKKL